MKLNALPSRLGSLRLRYTKASLMLRSVRLRRLQQGQKQAQPLRRCLQGTTRPRRLLVTRCRPRSQHCSNGRLLQTRLPAALSLFTRLRARLAYGSSRC